VQVDADPSTPILWALRDTLGLTGSKFGCGAALCGACTVHVNGQAVRSCVTPISGAAGQRITTIEAITSGSDKVGTAVHIVPSTEPPTGMGEPGLPPLAPAFANAVAALVGKPLRELPFRLA
jgi:hypothetical protein